MRFLTNKDHEILEEMDSESISYLGPMIQVSGVCNLKCTMCGGARELIPGKFMEESTFKTICEKLKADDIHGMIIAGAYGEPFLHPKIFDFLEYAKSLEFTLVLSTHGNNFDEARIQRLVSLDLNYIQFSFCGYNEETYQRIYKGGKFEVVVKNIILMKRYLKGHNQTQFVVNGVCDSNDQELADRTRDLLNNLGVEDHEMRIILPHNFGGTAHFDEMQRFGEIYSFKQIPKQHLSICQVLAKTPGILWDGRISACGCLDHKGQLALGNIKINSLREARKSEAFKIISDSFRKGDVSGIPLCNSCDVPYGGEGALPFQFKS